MADTSRSQGKYCHHTEKQDSYLPVEQSVLNMLTSQLQSSLDIDLLQFLLLMLCILSSLECSSDVLNTL